MNKFAKEMEEERNEERRQKDAIQLRVNDLEEREALEKERKRKEQ